MAFLVQQSDALGRWRTVITAETRPRADELAEELRQALADSPYTPSAPVRVVSDAELMREVNMSDAARVILSRL
jgi:hypothetical protein